MALLMKGLEPPHTASQPLPGALTWVLLGVPTGPSPGIHLHTAEVALLQPTPSGPQTLRRGETLCSEADLPLEPQEHLFLLAFAPLRPDPGNFVTMGIRRACR